MFFASEKALTQVSLYYLIFVHFALFFSETNTPFVEVDGKVSKR